MTVPAANAAKRAIVSRTGRVLVKSGTAKLTAESSHEGKRTHLTRLSHAAPMRLIPIGSSAVQRAGAALVALGSYGGGMLQGDSNDLEIKVGGGATLGIVTQGSNRIYKCNRSRGGGDAFSSMLYPSGEDDSTCRSTVKATIEKNGLLVMAPDPCVMFSASSFVQDQHIYLEPGASAVLIDWFGAGRVCNGERWDFTKLASRLSLYNGDRCPFLVESVLMDKKFATSQEDPFGFDAGDNEFNAFCSVILHGPQVQAVADRCRLLERQIAEIYTRTRDRIDRHDSSSSDSQQDLLDLNTLSGRVVMGVSRVAPKQGGLEQDDDNSTYVVRLAATSNEDIYRVLHSSLLPLQNEFGLDFYRDRIRASATATYSHAVVQGRRQEEAKTDIARLFSTDIDAPSDPLSARAAWCAYMLADSGLPTGGFAHSAGIEAASQLGLFSNKNGHPDEQLVSSYIQAAARSTTQLLTPFTRASHDIVVNTEPEFNVERAHERWLDLDSYAHALLSSNSPACRASLDQGQGLLRVAKSWITPTNAVQQANRQQHLRLGHDDAVLEVIASLQRSVLDSSHKGHIAPIFGLVGGVIGLSSQESCRVLGFCAARDMVSAAVRLNLVGPLASVSILDRTWSAVNDGYQVAIESFQSSDDRDVVTLVNAAACSPVADAVHPCQDLLSVRLFRT